MAKNKESFFWTSYSDLMTSLFFIMLVLFILVIVLLHRRMEATEMQLEEIIKIEESTKDLEGKYFTYNNDYEKFVLNINCQFPVNEYDINLLNESTKSQLIEAGKQIRNFLKRHKKNQYLVIVEGQASKNSPKWTYYNYELSYKRALSLRNFWAYNSIEEIKFPQNCELQIAGSGDGTLNVETMRENYEPKNQRFLIYIIPKNIFNNENK